MGCKIIFAPFKSSYVVVTVLVAAVFWHNHPGSEAALTKTCPNPRLEALQSFPGVCGLKLLHQLGDVCRRRHGSPASQQSTQQLLQHVGGIFARPQTAIATNSLSTRLKMPALRTPSDAFVNDAFVRAILAYDPTIANTFIRSRRQVTFHKWHPQNLVCECCFNYCSTEEMLSWC